jgi:hypothetical protein
MPVRRLGSALRLSGDAADDIDVAPMLPGRQRCGTDVVAGG